MLFRHFQRNLAGCAKPTLKHQVCSHRIVWKKSSNALIYGCSSPRPSASSETAASDASWESGQPGSRATVHPMEQLISHKAAPNYTSISGSWGSEQGWESLRQPEGTLSVQLHCIDAPAPPDLSCRVSCFKSMNSDANI